MELRSSKNTPRAGPSKPVAAGESRTAPPSGGGGLPQVYGGGTLGVPSVSTDEVSGRRRRKARKRRTESTPEEDNEVAGKRTNSPLLVQEEEVEVEVRTEEEVLESDDSEYQDPMERCEGYERLAERGMACRSQTPLTSEWEQEDESEGPEDIAADGTVRAGTYHECSRHFYRIYKKRRQRVAAHGEDETDPDLVCPENARLKYMARVLNAKAKVAAILARVTAKRKKMPPREPSAQTLGATLQDDVAILLEATKSHGRPKGIFARAIKLATTSLTKATSKLVEKASDYERLLERVAEMRVEIDQLRQEVAGRSRPSQVSQTPQATQTEAKEVTMDADRVQERREPPLTIGMIGAMMDAKIAGIADRLLPEKRLRPPLEADKSAARERLMAPKPAKNKKKAKRKRPAAVPPVAELPAVPSSAMPSVAPTREPRKESWATVAAKKAKPKKRSEPTSRPSPSPRKAKKGGAKYRRKLVRTLTEAVTLTLPEGSQHSYAEVMSTAKGAVKLEEIGVAPGDIRQRRVRTGGLLLELAGPECGEKADRLSERLSASLSALGVRVSRPIRTREVRVLDLDDSTTMEDVTRAVASAGGCAAETIKVGNIRRAPGYLGVAWVRCPLAAAQRLLTTGHVVVGWCRARVEALEAKAEFCFRCLECGHVAAQCPNRESGRGARCFKCSEPGHKARECQARDRRCPLCADVGLPHTHRLGSKGCVQAKGGRVRPPQRSGAVQGAAVDTAAPMETEAPQTGRADGASSTSRAATAGKVADHLAD